MSYGVMDIRNVEISGTQTRLFRRNYGKEHNPLLLMARKSTTHILGPARKSSGFIPGPAFGQVVITTLCELSILFVLGNIFIFLLDENIA